MFLENRMFEVILQAELSRKLGGKINACQFTRSPPPLVSPWRRYPKLWFQKEERHRRHRRWFHNLPSPPTPRRTLHEKERHIGANCSRQTCQTRRRKAVAV